MSRLWARLPEWSLEIHAGGRAPGIAWPEIIGMRNVLAHEYGTVVLDRVYDVVVDHLPELLSQLKPLIALLERDVGWDR